MKKKKKKVQEKLPELWDYPNVKERVASQLNRVARSCGDKMLYTVQCPYHAPVTPHVMYGYFVYIVPSGDQSVEVFTDGTSAAPVPAMKRTFAFDVRRLRLQDATAVHKAVKEFDARVGDAIRARNSHVEAFQKTVISSVEAQGLEAEEYTRLGAVSVGLPGGKRKARVMFVLHLDTKGEQSMKFSFRGAAPPESAGEIVNALRCLVQDRGVVVEGT